MYQVFNYEDGMELPTKGTYFVVASNGIFMHQDNQVFSCFVKVENIAHLDDFNSTHIKSNLPKVPANMVWQIKEFFRVIVEKYNSESEVTLYYNPDKKLWKIYVPEQVVSHCSVSYRRIPVTHLPEMEGYLCVGTIHSHADFGAFHSGTDMDDESDFNGLHVTFGNNDKDVFTISSTFVVNNNRVVQPSLDVLEGIKQENGRIGTYSLLPVDDDVKSKLVEEVLEWVKKVQHASSVSSCVINPTSTVEQKRKNNVQDCSTVVNWAEDIGKVLVDVYGPGPFKVSCKTKFAYFVETDNGPVSLPAAFFVEVSK